MDLIEESFVFGFLVAEVVEDEAGVWEEEAAEELEVLRPVILPTGSISLSGGDGDTDEE